MSYFEKKFLPWAVRVLNVALVTFSTAAATTLGMALAVNGQTINLASDWNAWITLKILAISWAVQFFVAFGALLKQSPLPSPDEE